MNLTAFSRTFALIIITCLLLSCGGSHDGGAPVTNKEAEKNLPARIKSAEKSIQELGKKIEAGRISNTAILKDYADILTKQKPELISLVKNLKRDATIQGGLYGNLQNRLDTLKSQPDIFETPKVRYQEANALIDASRPDNYDNALTDVINVMADMSDGTLPRINAQSKQQSLSTNNATDLGAGSQLIGNPSYGQWSNHGGTSVWEWYGMYSMFRDLTGGRNYSYDRWNSNRDWSYYNDVGRNRYGNARTSTTNAPQKKRYGFDRSYGSNKKSYGSSSSDRRASSYSKSTSSKKSSFSKSSTSSSFRSRSSFSRGGFGGK